MSAFIMLDKLTKDANSFRLQDKMKLWFMQAHTKEHSFSVSWEALGQRGDTLKALKGLREIVARDVVKLGVLEQLLAATLVGIPLKAGYVADMEDKEYSSPVLVLWIHCWEVVFVMMF
ncbi:hypothetical protein Tco_0239255 [Tanacetum coccineum]